jgi:hypothetical protein
VHALKLSGVPIDGILHITRSPYDFVKSSEKQGKSLLKASIRYRMYHKEAERLRSQFPYIRVSYEELAESTDKTLERLFNFINVPVVGVDELKENFNDAWHFMGNASLLKFDGTMRLSTYNVEERIKNKIILLTGGQLSSVYL